MQIIYHKIMNKIINTLGDDQLVDLFYQNYPNDFKEQLVVLQIDKLPEQKLRNYIIDNDELILRPHNDIQDLELYGKILTEEDRLNMLLKPSSQEILKAENTLDILLVLQEVGLI